MRNIHPTRRSFTLGAAGGALLAACAVDGAFAPPPPEPARCTVYPQQMEGPFYLDLDTLKRDITDGKPGVPLALTIRVLAARGCAPVGNVAVDVWHCDALGVYSEPAAPFLRGTQVTDRAGRVTFATIFPGWYPGRTAHVHVKVHLAGSREATSQLYFPEDVKAAVYATDPYRARAGARGYTTNDEDGILHDGGTPTLLAVRAVAGGYAATLDMGVV